MTVLHKRYERLGAYLRLMVDDVVLVQAQKRTGAYICRLNWCADRFGGNKF